MGPDRLAEIAAQAYLHMIPWSAKQFAATLENPAHLLFCTQNAFVLGQIAGDEAEILALACVPDHQRRGEAGRVLNPFIQKAKLRSATRILLEVAEPNLPAIRFYQQHGFADVGLRKNYYRQADGSFAHALVMARDVT